MLFYGVYGDDADPVADGVHDVAVGIAHVVVTDVVGCVVVHVNIDMGIATGIDHVIVVVRVIARVIRRLFDIVVAADVLIGVDGVNGDRMVDVVGDSVYVWGCVDVPMCEHIDAMM